MAVNLSATLRKVLQARSAEELARIADAWAVEEVPEDGWLGATGMLGEKLQDMLAARTAWEGLSEDARDLLHQIITFELVDGVPREDLQKLARLADVSFAAALAELEHRLMLVGERPNSKVRLRMETRDQQANHVLAIPKDFRAHFAAIDHEIYDSSGDRSQMKLVNLLESMGASKLQVMATLHNLGMGFSYYTYYTNNPDGLASSLAGKLVQAQAIEAAWERLDPVEQKLCRWLCRADGSAQASELRAALDLSKPALNRHLRQLENYGLVFDTFSGQERKIFIGRGIFKVLRKVINELDRLEGQARQAPEAVVLQEVPPVVHEAQGMLLYDLAIAVGAVHQQVIEPTQAGRVPKRLANKIWPLLHGSRPDHYEETDNYLDMVFAITQSLGLIQLKGSTGQKARYVPGPELAEWARLDQSEQIRRLLALWWHPGNNFWSDVAGANYHPTGYYGFGYYMDMLAARKGLLEYVMRHCKPGEWYALEPFLQNIRAHHPLLLREHSRYAAYNGMQNRKEVLRSWDQNDGELIAGMLASSLHELGLVTTGYTREPARGEEAGNPQAFQFTSLAAETLWNTQQPAEKQATVATEQPRTLIVQPNFELLLLQPDYLTLYQLLPFTRVEQVEMVSRLTLTQESVRRGVEAGLGVERIVQTLQERSQKELPQNVLYTLQDWSRLYKDATVSQIILLEVSSEAVADEICASPKFRALELRRLGPRAIAVGGQVSLQVLRSTLEKDSVILHVQGDILSVREAASTSTYYGRRK